MIGSERTAPLAADQLSDEERETFAPENVDYWLEVAKGVDGGRSLRVEAPVVVGTAESCEVRLTDPTVSRTHARVWRTDEGVWLEDLGSRNGTVLAGAKVHRVLIRREAWISVGGTLLRLAAVPKSQGSRVRFGAIVGESSSMQALFTTLHRAAPSMATVLLVGETGTGKEHVARELHAHSPRRHRPYQVLDCRSVALELLPSELFGHTKGAFTGADRERAGAFERADGGTLFLDEVGELPLEAQPALLRVLEGRTVRRVGGDEERSVDVRVIASTQRDLRAAVRSGQFREDLFYRLAVIEARVPPLRERREDLPALVALLLGELGRPQLDLPPLLRDALTAYAWPGNVRELRNLLESAVLGLDLGASLAPRAAPTEPTRPAAQKPAGEPAPFKEAKEALLEEFTREYFTTLFERSGGNVAAMAKSAGIARTYAHEVIKKLGLK